MTDETQSTVTDDAQPEPPARPPEADVEKCEAAVGAFVDVVTVGCTGPADSYRNLAYSLGLVKKAVQQAGEAAREARIAAARTATEEAS